MRLTILGAGAFGGALASVATRSHQAKQLTNLQVWARRPKVAEAANQKNTFEKVTFSSDLATCLSDAEAIIYALPAQAFRAFFSENQDAFKTMQGVPLLVTAKGLEKTSGLFYDEILDDIGVQFPLAVFGGPHLASELKIPGNPTIGLIGGQEERVAQLFSSVLAGPDMQIATTADSRGVMLANAFKNVMALLGGVLRGEKASQNTLNAFLAQGFQEILVLSKALGVQRETCLHAALLGDFLLTTGSTASRNTQAGIMIGQGKVLDENMLAEGVFTLEGLLKRAKNEEISLPLCEGLYQRIHYGTSFKLL